MYLYVPYTLYIPCHIIFHIMYNINDISCIIYYIFLQTYHIPYLIHHILYVIYYTLNIISSFKHSIYMI